MAALGRQGSIRAGSDSGSSYFGLKGGQFDPFAIKDRSGGSLVLGLHVLAPGFLLF